MSQDQRFAGTTPSAMQHSQPVGNNTGAILSQSKARTPSDRISIRTPPVGGVISTPSPCKMYKLTNTGGYPRSQPRQHNEQGMHRPMTQSSPAGSQMRSRSSTPTMSLSRSVTPNRYNSPRDLNSLMSSSQQRQNNNSTPMATPSNKTPYTSRPDSGTPMQINSTLDPAQRQIRLTYQPRTALMSKVTPRSSQQTA
ncbi:uncharacterized protein LOC135690836 [Rhopilema esculentum]|uniref:uncharacterized protein LOC135690836 n=1 Tax=Rhopilema esculentum TaxID=499914 RepID=UPI0031D7C09B